MGPGRAARRTLGKGRGTGVFQIEATAQGQGFGQDHSQGNHFHGQRHYRSSAPGFVGGRNRDLGRSSHEVIEVAVEQSVHIFGSRAVATKMAAVAQKARVWVWGSLRRPT